MKPDLLMICTCADSNYSIKSNKKYIYSKSLSRAGLKGSKQTGKGYMKWGPTNLHGECMVVQTETVESQWILLKSLYTKYIGKISSF